MTTVEKSAATNWSISWIYTKDEWAHFERWSARRKGVLNYLWYFLFHKNDRRMASVLLTEQWVKIGNNRKYFVGPVTELKRVEISDFKELNIMSITYEIVSKGQLNEISLPIPKGKLKEAIEAQQKLTTGRTIVL